MLMKEMVSNIIELYTENERLRTLVYSEKSKVEPTNDVEKQVTGKTILNNEIIKLGKMKMLDNLLYYDALYGNLRENTDGTFESFKCWLSRNINRGKIPSYCSYDDFVTYFLDDLKALYDERLKETQEDEVES